MRHVNHTSSRRFRKENATDAARNIFKIVRPPGRQEEETQRHNDKKTMENETANVSPTSQPAPATRCGRNRLSGLHGAVAPCTCRGEHLLLATAKQRPVPGTDHFCVSVPSVLPSPSCTRITSKRRALKNPESPCMSPQNIQNPGRLRDPVSGLGSRNGPRVDSRRLASRGSKRIREQILNPNSRFLFASVTGRTTTMGGVCVRVHVCPRVGGALPGGARCTRSADAGVSPPASPCRPQELQGVIRTVGTP